jgi:hypothetical protein
MHIIKLTLAAALIATTAAAQVPPGTDPMTGTRPGHTPGVGTSLPLSNTASNITPGRSTIAPTLPQPVIGEGAMAQDYLRVARASLLQGKSGQAQQSLEMAETRLLDHVVPPGGTTAPSSLVLVGQIRDARMALASGDTATSIAIIDRALSN